MILFWLTIIYFPSLLFGKYIFERWFNPVFIYSSSWAFIIFMYNLELIRYTRVSFLTWLVIVLAYFAFITGVLIFKLGKNLEENNSVKEKKSNRYFTEKWWNEREKVLKRIIVITAIIGLLVSLQHWYVLIKKFGSITMVFLNANDIYQQRVSGEHFGQIPYLNLLSYVSVFFSAIYSAYKNKFTVLVLLPLLAVILTDAASLARAGVFFALMIFGITFITARYFFKKALDSPKYSNNRNIIITSILVVLLAFAGVSVIRMIRNPMGDFISTSIELKKLSNNGIISSSLYLYFSSPVVVLSQYLDERNEKAIFGENTFYPVYNNLKKLGGNFNLRAYPKGYFIPMWVNSATYIRDLDADFGTLGVFIVPFIIGFISTFYWFKYFATGRLINLAFYSFTTVLIVFSVFYIGTRLTFWFWGFLFSLLTAFIFEHVNLKRSY